jgi:hypothetical protein
MPRKKSQYRIVPTTNEKFGSCWALKEGTIILGVFITKDHAEKRKLQLESKTTEDFLLVATRNQELKIED